MTNAGCVRTSRHIIWKLFLALALSLSVLAPARAQTFTVIHTFQGADGANPRVGLTLDRAGNLYGTTITGGTEGLGTVFKMTRGGSGWVLTRIFEFNSSDGYSPLAPVVFGPDGALYGSAQFGGQHYDGVIFRLQPPATFCRAVSCPWTQTVLANLYGVYGIAPSGPLSFDAAGNIYGTAQLGGNFNHLPCSTGGLGCGTVYQLIKSQNWAMNSLYAFTGNGDGIYPYGGVILDPAGNLYGTAQGANIFELVSSGGGWTFNLIAGLVGNDGYDPYAGLIWDDAGNLYGAAAGGGSGRGGTVFQLSPSGGGWNLNILASLTGSGGLYDGPLAALFLDSAGNLYGTTQIDGAFGCGSVFKLSPSGAGYTFTALHDFTCGTDGANPFSSLTMDAGGNLYGTAAYGGDTGCDNGLGCGVVFEITP